MTTAVEWLAEQLYPAIKLDSKIIDEFVAKAKEMEKQQTLLFAEDYEEYVFRGGSAIVERYYEETFKNQQDI